MTELLIGCGHSRQKRLALPGQSLEFTNLITVDNNPKCNPHIICDLNTLFWCPQGPIIREEGTMVSPVGNRFQQSFYTEIHAYEVLEHLGRQGDVPSFFSTFTNLWRILRPGGHVFATVPSRFSPWLWGDPGHTRAILPESLIFLSQNNYAQCDGGKSPMTDYRSVYKADFNIVHSVDDRTFHSFILQAIK